MKRYSTERRWGFLGAEFLCGHHSHHLELSIDFQTVFVLLHVHLQSGLTHSVLTVNGVGLILQEQTAGSI